METEIQTLLIFVIFAVFVYLMYRAIKLAIQAAIVTVVSFSFPWIIKFLGVNLPIDANIETGLYFAILGLGLFILYHIFHFVVYLLKLILWPLRR
ncbi:MAG: hypothetical protein GXO63_01080 [Candidatus Micrarchaeota archaeon]|nr:hypothetical protein [Candidatus Micrarchaeota archaeon]